MDSGAPDSGSTDAGRCATAADCPPSSLDCEVGECTAGQCTTAFADDGTPAAHQVTGDCRQIVCDGQGGRRVIDDVADVFDDGNSCTDDLCTAGSPQNLPSLTGSSCSDGSGTLCDGLGACVECVASSDCAQGTCKVGRCLAAACFDGAKDGDETDVDCGGACLGCDVGRACAVPADCVDRRCDPGTLHCVTPSCTDGVEDGAETDVDCGAGCTTRCAAGQACAADSDCIGGRCSGSVCLPTCSDGVADGIETGVDCGGPDCPKCPSGDTCQTPDDCASGVCSITASQPTCTSPLCTDGVKNQDESDVDCGGACPGCGAGRSCALDSDCAGGRCQSGSCAASCADLVKNGNETDVDCGGSCATCAAGKACNSCWDCAAGLTCSAGVCGTPPACPSGWGTCGSSSDYCSTGGCETNLMSDKLNCGQCDHACDSGEVCGAGQCYRAWGVGTGDEQNQAATGVAVDGAGNFYVVGDVQGFYDLGWGAFMASDGYDIFLAKFDPDGNLLNLQQFGDVGDQHATSVAVDAAGNVVIAGRNAGLLDLGVLSLVTNGGDDAIVFELDSTGVPLWGQDFGDVGTESATAVAFSGTTVVVGGNFTATADFGLGPITNAGVNDVWLATLDSSGATKWAKGFGDASNQILAAIGVDGQGNVYGVGSFGGSIDFGSGAVTSQGANDVFTMKLDSSGNGLWSKAFGDANSQTSNGLAVTAAGRTAIVGRLTGSMDFGLGPLVNTNGFDTFVVTFDASGNAVWNQALVSAGTGNVDGRRIAFDASGGAVVAGTYTGSADFGTASSNLFVAHYDADGAYLRGTSFGQNGGKTLSGLGLQPSGKAIIAGSYSLTGIDFGGGLLPVGGAFDLFVAQVSP